MSLMPPPHPQRALMQEEMRRLAQARATLLPEHENRYIAFYLGEVLDSDEDLDPLVARIQAAYPDAVVLIQQLSRAEAPILEVRSPRLLP
ncbi:MAG: hypothetical protein KDE28_10365 [Anaerolineales bacterium]|nr:hypothetical protein [Anaerolineales bacterium]